MDEKEIDKKLKEIRKILDDPFHVSPQKDKYLSTLQKRLMKSPPTDSPHVIIFSKDNLEKKEDTAEEFTIKEREEEIVEGETLFTIEREETADIPEFIEIKPEEKEEETQEFIEEKPEETKEENITEKTIEEEPAKPEETPEFIEIKPEEKEEKRKDLPQWKPVEEVETLEEKPEKIEQPIEKKKTKEKKHKKRFQIWEPAKEKKTNREKKKKEESFEPFIEEDFEEEFPEEKTDDNICRYRGYTLYKKDITLTDGTKRTIHFFSREKPEEGEPSSLPSNYEIKIDKKTGVPFIRKKR